jgi:hypothetical protein
MEEALAPEASSLEGHGWCGGGRTPDVIRGVLAAASSSDRGMPEKNLIVNSTNGNNFGL